MPLRARFHVGPALRRLRLPLAPTVASAIAHAAFFAAVIYGAATWGDQPKPVIVNLVPAIAAVGSPRGSPALPPRAEETPVAKSSPAELPRREPSRDLPSRELPQRDSVGLPDRSLPARAPGLPRPDDKELPAASSVSTARATTPAPATPTPARRDASPPPPPPLGAPGGSAQGAGALTLNVADFPYSWYISIIHRKVQENWASRANPGQQPAVIFEIARDGGLNQVIIDKSSGNRYYDDVALSAIKAASPFPPLPIDFKKPVLRVGLQFVFDPTWR